MKYCGCGKPWRNKEPYVMLWIKLDHTEHWPKTVIKDLSVMLREFCTYAKKESVTCYHEGHQKGWVPPTWF